MSNKISSQDAVLAIQTTAGPPAVFTTVAGFKDWSGLLGGSASVIDVTDLASTAKENLKGLKDEGQFKADLFYVPGDAGQAAMRANRDVPGAVNFKLTLSNGDVFAFAGLVLTFEVGGSVDQVVTVSSTIQISGAVTFTAASGS